ncbi:MAG: hypothetical protein JWR80_6368 [Bradyrhizobium sp.]|nr:hypothetical protein [Bradyrhizobium sp.]
MNVGRMKAAMENELAAAGATDEQIASYGALWKHSIEATPAGAYPCPVCFMRGVDGRLRLLTNDDDKEQATCPTCGEHFYWPAA